MDTNITPPRYGSRSYAELIKQRLIYGRFYAGWSMAQGRYVFRVMMDPADTEEYSWRRQPIGYEMTGLSHTNNGWALRVYLDGTALYRPFKLGGLRYPTMSCIKAVMEYFFYTEQEIESPSPYGRYNKTYVLRRKPLNPHHIAPVAKGFGDFLTGKYNKGGAA